MKTKLQNFLLQYKDAEQNLKIIGLIVSGIAFVLSWVAVIINL